MIIGADLRDRFCRACGCSDSRACMTDDGPCAWVLIDVDLESLERGAQATSEAQPRSGVCSACAEEFGWEPRFLLLAGLEEQPQLLSAAGGLR